MRLHVEVPFFLLIFAFSLSDPVTTNLMVYRTCYLILNYTVSDCALLGSGNHSNETTEMEEKIQPYVTILSMSKYLTETVIGAIICFFLGPWSDKYGRRPVMLYTLGGYTIGYIIITVISALPNVSPWYLLLSCAPICLFGGFPALLTVTLCHITDSTSLDHRGVRLGVFEALITTGALSGSVLSSFIFNYFGYLILYSITTLCIFSSWFTIFVAIPESVQALEREGKFRNLFKCSSVADAFKATFKRRVGFDRALLLIVITLVVIFLLAETADGSIIFLYLRRKLSWSLKKYTLFNSGKRIAWISGSLIGGYLLHKLLDVPEAILVVIGFLSTSASASIQGYATKDWHMYLAGISKCFGGVISPMLRSLISKLVPVEEIGKVLSFVVITETLINIIGSPVYTYIYNKTIMTMPELFCYITAGIYVFEVVLTIPVIILQLSRHREGYELLNGETNIN